MNNNNNNNKSGWTSGGLAGDNGPESSQVLDTLQSTQQHERTIKGVSFHGRRLEPVIAWALTAGTAWTAMVAFPGNVTPWLAALFAIAIGAWARAYPARHPAMMLARAASLLVVALALHTDPALGGANGAYFYWSVAIAGAYALLLGWHLAIVLIVLSAVEYVLALWLTPPDGSLRPALAALGVLVIWPGVGMVLARALHRANAEVEAALTDAQTGLYNAAGLFQYGSELFLHCRREERPITLALLRCHNLSEAHRAIGRGATTQVLAGAMRDLLAAVPGAAIAARIDMRDYAVLLPDVAAPRVKALMKVKLGDAPVIETLVNGKTIAITVDIAVSGAREETHGLEALYERTLSKMRVRRRQAIAARTRPPLSSPSPHPPTAAS